MGKNKDCRRRDETRPHVTQLSLCLCCELKVRVRLTGSLVSWMVGYKVSVFSSTLFLW